MQIKSLIASAILALGTVAAHASVPDLNQTLSGPSYDWSFTTGAGTLSGGVIRFGAGFDITSITLNGVSSVWSNPFNFGSMGESWSLAATTVSAGTQHILITGTGSGIINGHVDFASSTSPLPAAPVPEPETYAMMLAGLGALGFVGRRRKAQAK